ncbi:hypothetical protein M758_4G108100 [Ceratodon purpureus]|uniref:Secreted protein n=1 Tax=Ceratodon purpureus TaxID=3225 RepID=A0A8T0GZA9_CERPU|nr:hypothetical protein KC19_8G169300 [Ceratodon purpureus]KAG0618996.1 hypothetical protein M758_4G108100 [Ceratodon purpureus]
MVASLSYRCVLCVTVPVLAASINPKLASTLIRDLGTKAPLTSLAHVKRIRKIKTEGGIKNLTLSSRWRRD